MSTKIISTDILDLRVPTSDSMLGSDPFHKKPNYSCVYTSLKLANGISGNSICFTSGAGNDWIAYGAKDISKLLKGYDLADFIDEPGSFYKLVNDHHQLRWLADGVNRMALGCIINALWDAWAKVVKKPMWKLLVDLPSTTIIKAIDWRYLTDSISQEEAIEILDSEIDKQSDQERKMLSIGAKAYSTAGWIGLSDNEIQETIQNMQKDGFDCFKMKVGQNIDHDVKRLNLIRNLIGPKSKLMLDCNQFWGVDEAIDYMKKLAKFNPVWIEEPTARDDVLGHLKISKALKSLKIGIAAGEQVPSPVVFKQLLTSKALDYCQIDASRLAGVNDVLAVILIAKKNGIPVCPHGGGIGLCNKIIHYAIWDQIRVSKHSDNQLVEYIDFLQEDVFIEPVRVFNGCYVTPHRPGWGIELVKDFKDNYLYPDGKVWQGRELSGGITFLP